MSHRRILNVGLGGRGRGWLRHLLSRPDLQSVGWVDPSEASLEAAREVAPEVRVPTFSSVREATRRVEADIAVIAAASTVRLENCLEAIDAGLHILVEKPFALSLADARTIVDAADRRGMQIVVGQNYRYIPSIAEMARQIRAGRLGKLGIGCFFRTRRRFGSGTYQQHLRHNYLWEMSVHDFDLIRFTLGLNPRTITGWSWLPPWGDFTGETAVQVLIEFEQEVKVNYLGAWACWVTDYFWRVDGSAGVLRAGRDLEYADTESGAFKCLEFEPVANRELPLLDELIEAARTGVPARTSGRDNLWTIAMMEAAQSATDRDGSVDVSALIAD